MKHEKLRCGKGFRVVFSNQRVQAAAMVIPPGDAEGDPSNRHRGADQWLYVVSGTNRALVNGKRVALRAGVLLLIEHKDRHEIKNNGKDLLKMLNFHSPPAYGSGGDELSAAQP